MPKPTTIELETDLQILNRARDAACYAGYTNSLVEWTMTRQWTQPEWIHARSQESPAPVSGEIEEAR